ncbi:MAG: hypothetical protein ABW184_08795 [Sphingobium sp.]
MPAIALPGSTNALFASILIGASRRWRVARDNGDAVQPSLFAELSLRRCGMLAPVLDSLMALYEAALGRAVAVSRAALPSDDERLLLDLMSGARTRANCIACADGLGSALDTAIGSTRIMMAMMLDGLVDRR